MTRDGTVWGDVTGGSAITESADKNSNGISDAEDADSASSE
jgi:hypothetical protein